MMMTAARKPLVAGGGVVAMPVGALAAGSAAGLLVAFAGPQALIVPLGLAALLASAFYPRRALIALIAAVVVADSASVGAPGQMLAKLWDLTPEIQRQLPLKSSAFEALILVAACAAFLRAGSGGRVASLPWVVRCVPVVLGLGMAYGLANGGPLNLVYHEARGLIFATIVFVALRRVGGLHDALALRIAIVTTTLLGLLVAARYMMDLRAGAIPREVWFGHETGLFLAAGVVLGAVLLLRARAPGERAWLLAYTALMALSLTMTGRRSGILVIVVGLAVAAWMVFPRRPALMTAMAIASACFSAVYLQAFWDSSAGAIAEPAQAVRSQFDPSERDASSDRYREVERRNLVATIERSPAFGVGFGRPFDEVEELPPLDFWPLQHYTPHQNILWLWLKTGILGLAVLGGTWVIAFSRCARACRVATDWREVPVSAVVLASVLAMYAVYATIDLALPPVRPAVIFAVVLAQALAIAPPCAPPRGHAR